MEKKRCPRCKKPLPRDDFNKCSSRSDGLSVYCRSCTSTYAKKKYSENRDYYKKKAADRKRAVREKLHAVTRKLKEAPCPDCGRTYPAFVMDFDHVRGKKKFSIGSAISSVSQSMENILREIKKCEAVCSNCHRIRTHSRSLKGKGATLLK